MSKEMEYGVIGVPLQPSQKSSFRVIPAGPFKSSDGRPSASGHWVLTKDNAEKIIANLKASLIDLPIDYEHQTMLAEKNGKPAPAAGWFKQLEWRDDGLYVVDARWTDRAREMIDKQEYRYISPTFVHDASFVVRGLHSIALTNTPALHGLTDLSKLTAEKVAQAGSTDFGGDRSNECMQNFLDQCGISKASALSSLSDLSKLSAESRPKASAADFGSDRSNEGMQRFLDQCNRS